MSARPMGGSRGGAAIPIVKPKDFKGTTLRLLSFMKPFRIGLFAVLALTVLAAVFNNLGPRVLGFATNELQRGAEQLAAGTGTVDFSKLGFILTALGVLYLMGALLTYLQHYLMAGISQKTMYLLRREIDHKLRRLPLGYFDGNSFGDILSRVTNDVDTVSNTLQQGINQILSSLLTLLTILVMMLVISPLLTLIALCTLPLTLLLSMGVIKRSQPLFEGQQKSLGELGGHIEEMYTGHSVIKAFGREQEVIDEFERINQERYQNSWKANYMSGILIPVSYLIGNLGYILVTVAGGYMAIQGRLLVGDIQSFIQYLRNFTQPLTQISNMANTLQSTIAAAERIFAFLDEAEEQPDAPAAEKLEEVQGNVAFEQVQFGYRPDTVLIDNFNLQVQSGDTIAIVGPTGAGKTTLVNLLLRFYEVGGGRITLDGVDIRHMGRGHLRSWYGMVLQETWLFKGSIMENIRYGRLDATDQEVIEAAKAAYADGFIRSLPGGYQMELGEDAANLSQGQRQLLTIARAILSDPRILILDEATSSVDTRTEVLIQRATKALMKGRTSFVIAHRLSTIRDADHILVLDKGSIIETGNHRELLEQGGFYADLYNSQFAYNNAAGE